MYFTKYEYRVMLDFQNEFVVKLRDGTEVYLTIEDVKEMITMFEDAQEKK